MTFIILYSSSFGFDSCLASFAGNVLCLISCTEDRRIASAVKTERIWGGGWKKREEESITDEISEGEKSREGEGGGDAGGDDFRTIVSLFRAIYPRLPSEFSTSMFESECRLMKRGVRLGNTRIICGTAFIL